MISQITPSWMGAVHTPTLWGLTPTQIHDRFWAARGVQVVRQGEPSEIVDHAELFLLTDPRMLCIFKLARVVEKLSWLKPDVLFLRLHDGRERGYREQAIFDSDNRFRALRRIYGGPETRLARVALTPEPRLARLWQRCPDPRSGWQTIRQEVSRGHRSVLSLSATIYDRAIDTDMMQLIRELIQRWSRPDSTIGRIQESSARVWIDQTAEIDDSTTLIGPLWVGAGRRVATGTIVGPRVLWDDPAKCPPMDNLQWTEIEPTSLTTRRVTVRQRTSFSLATKRVFDILFALLAILLTLPLYPLIMLAIWLEDRRPFFFGHQRETVGGREFPCLKFRSMRRDAEKIKEQLAKQNQADGAQFYMENDPRVTRVGRFLRKTYLDELPQFWNILLGHMSVVGPRPSPFRENQYCPPWREARLSVRPGVTGLWQVKRTRRQGLDFQEWIKYDIEYVENISWRLDLWIIWETVRLVVRGVIRS